MGAGTESHKLGQEEILFFLTDSRFSKSTQDCAWESEAGARGDSLGFRQLTSSSHPFCGMVPGTRTERFALMMHSASSVFHLLYNHASSSAGMRPRIRHCGQATTLAFAVHAPQVCFLLALPTRPRGPEN